eukprot:CAMPEP_0116133752 /NCGR_PEP_ID=MMETSP0329-20121206/10274_1 /TAXON_ID=697910 /ORGANISM="Pseudo-nitzschia arenysensis, Strain B593" /LENGTH=642 /DNA_ID=CAMNT_0003628405 /DNA_START=170 /DNA_END=2098 /DNA_ORIENTATION=+
MASSCNTPIDNCFCNPCNTNNNDRSGPNKTSEASKLSMPVPSLPCLLFDFGGQGTDQGAGMVTGTNNRGANLVDEEAEALQEEMQKLNLRERHAADQTVLGNSAEGIRIDGHYSDVVDETTQVNLFRELEETIQRIRLNIGIASNPQFQAYSLARHQNTNYVTHPSFTIGFLRAERYNTEKAAYRMFTYLKIKLDLFGAAKLTQDILIDDLGEDGRGYLARGGLQVLPRRDSSGRRVVFGTGVLKGSSDASAIESAKKAYFYFWTSISEDDNELGRIKGIAGIIWRVHEPPMPSPIAAEALSQIWLCVPMRISAYHVCYGPRVIDIQYFENFAKMSLVWFKNKNFMRYRRAHFGEALEIMYAMFAKYGMPSESFPINHSASEHRFTPLGPTDASSKDEPLFHVLAHKEWMEKRIALDQQKRQLITSLTATRGLASATLVLSSFRSSNGSTTMDDFANLLRPSNESMSADQSLNGSMSDMDLDDTSMDIVVDSSKFSIPSNGAVAAINGWIADQVDDANSFDNDLHESQELSEALLSTTGTPANEIPQDDIKLGRGRPLQNHPGNQWLRHLVREEFEDYDNSDRRNQTRKTIEIVQRVRSEGRRFWKKIEASSDRWIEVDDDEARETVAIKFRTERKIRSNNA